MYRILTLFIAFCISSSAIALCQKPTIHTKVIGQKTDTVLLDKETNIEMVYVPGGTFNFEHAPTTATEFTKVTISSFYVSKYEITKKQWKAVMHNHGSFYDHCDLCPVDNVSWHDAEDFINALNELVSDHYRLPTEAEWEFAAKGGLVSKHYTYSGGNDIDEVGWYAANSNDHSHPVGRKKPNELGIYDMTGNVSEWCSDWDGYNITAPINAVNPGGPSNGSSKIWRGGSYSDNTSDKFPVLNFKWNGRSWENGRFETIGFRLVRDSTKIL